ncbi:MAG TPA: glycoside hydrolase family 99-like domain-containing protein, partial [Terriglobales bacterium]|nr:glycoside hydrolase family 99-like domain-containing protein [Terriglobales bacterium]
VPFIPTAMSGWDPRPWNEREFMTGDLMWYSRSPREVANFVSDAIDWTNLNQQLRPEPASVPPLVLIEAWNEFGEGSHVIPTAGDGTAYGDALAAMLAGP